MCGLGLLQGTESILLPAVSLGLTLLSIAVYGWKIGVTLAIFGAVGSLSMVFTGMRLWSFVWLKVFYYCCQFLFVMWFHPTELCWESFLINQSKEYVFAVAIALAEYAVKSLCLGQADTNALYWAGLVLSVLGYGLRVLAFITAQSNFTHQVSYEKAKDHRLVTSGVYSVLRHPSYTGYYYFSMASQVMLGNWLTLPLYHLALRQFFSKRIQVEEYYLQQFFPEYAGYKASTWVAIPNLQLSDI